MKKLVKGVLVLFVLAIIGAVGLVMVAQNKVKQHLSQEMIFPQLEMDAAIAAADVELGHRIVQIRNACVECHGTDLAGKAVVDDPLAGTIYGANLTPAALGDWSNGEIARAIRYGVGRDNKPLLLMPSHEYQNLSFEDIAAVIAYLRTLSPIDRPNGEVSAGPLPSLLYFLGDMPTLIPAAGLVNPEATFADKPVEEVSWEFGKYLIKSSCVGCHRDTLQGGPIPGAPPDWTPASDLRPEALTEWTQEDFFKTMRTGINPSGKKLAFPFPAPILAQMTDVELGAMWKYLKESNPNP